jgi:hypothetical protein
MQRHRVLIIESVRSKKEEYAKPQCVKNKMCKNEDASHRVLIIESVRSKGRLRKAIVFLLLRVYAANMKIMQSQPNSNQQQQLPSASEVLSCIVSDLARTI